MVVLVVAALLGYYYMKPSDIYLNKHLNSTYDYIIVGAGSSGAVVANRLSEDPASSVLLVEAGGSELGILEFEIPAGFIDLQKTEYDWEYYTEPQQYSTQSMIEKRSYWPRGKVLGGTSNLNNMVYLRGSRHDFDEWSREGCDGWSFKDVLPYFIKAEDFQMEEYADSGYHGKGGYQTVSESVVTELRDIFMEASEDAGYKTVDCNGKDMIGFCKMQASIKKGQRWSTAKAYLRPIMARENLHISIKSYVTKIIIENKKAVGIEMVKDGVKRRIMVNKEVIISAGVVNSPQLLMLSGIGPKQHLNQFNIPVHADLPVGSNLQDHMIWLFPVKTNISYGLDLNKASSFRSILEYFILGKGYLTSSATEATLFAHSKKGDKSSYPDIQIHFLSINYDKGLARKYNLNNINETNLDEIMKSDAEISFFLLPTLIHPKSRGTIRLKSTDPFDHPSIDPRYLEEKKDIEVFTEAVRLCQKIVQTNMFQRYEAVEVNSEEVVAACNGIEFGTDEYFECRIRHFAQTVYHPTSTCRMGASNDPTAVVDPQLRVKGISGLRIVDASVMRNIPSANTNAPSIMIGEKASDMIRGKDTVLDIREKTKKL